MARGVAPGQLEGSTPRCHCQLARSRRTRVLYPYRIFVHVNSGWGKWGLGRRVVTAAVPAVGILGEKRPEAAMWWRENTPHLIAPRRYLVFHEEVCRIADI